MASKTIQIGKAKFKINTDGMGYKNTPDYYLYSEEELLALREAQVMKELAKVGKSKRKVLSKGQRSYPKMHSQSTKQYVEEYYKLNSEGRYPQGSIYGHSAVQEALVFFQALSTRPTENINTDVQYSELQ